MAVTAAGAAPPPSQAVILAGGRGTRLGALTDSAPKPMLELHGRPFLDYLLQQLAEQGFSRALILIGYLGHMIRDHFGGQAHGLQLTYVDSPVETDTGLRLAQAQAAIDDVALLMYCDNYWPMTLAPMWQRFCADGVDAQITVYANADGYTRNNLLVDSDGRIAVYDKSRRAAALNGVDIGYMLFRRQVLDRLPAGNVSFEAAVFPDLVAERRLGAFVSDHRYYSIGQPARLAATERFLARQPAVLLDRDGVLNERAPQGEYVTSWRQWRWRPGAREALARLNAAGFRNIVITNQAGIARGRLSEAELAAIHTRMRQEARAAGGDIAAIYHCPHHWDEGCGCRKPAPGMLFQAQRDFDLELPRLWFVGDDERDGEAAAAAGCRFAAVTEEKGLAAWVDDILADDDVDGSLSNGARVG